METKRRTGKLSSKEVDRLVNKLADECYEKIKMKVAMSCRHKADIEDVTHDILLYIICKLRRGVYRDTGSFHAWVGVVVSNYMITAFFRKPERFREDYTEGLSLLLPSDLHSLSPREREAKLSCLEKLVSELPKHQAELISLKFYSGMTYDEMSEYLSVKRSTVAARVKACCLALRKRMEECGYGDASL